MGAVAEQAIVRVRHQIRRQDGTTETCIESVNEPSPYTQALFSQGGQVTVCKAAWAGQWIIVARPKV